MYDLQSLSQRFAPVEGVSFRRAAELGWHDDGSRGLVVVENPFGRIVVALNGAHLMSWVPAGLPDVLWMSPRTATVDGRPIRGGIPLCTPWFGPGAEGLPLHGWARIVDWSVDDVARAADGTTRLVLVRAAAAEGGPGWSIDFDLRLEITLGESLTLGFSATNRAAATRPFEFAFHTYFAVGDVDATQVEGLDGCRFLDRQNGGEGTQAGPVAIEHPINRLYLDPPVEQIVRSPRGACRISSEARAALVWNPGAGDAGVADLGAGAHCGFVCAERVDAGPRAVELAPGATFARAMTLTALRPAAG